MLIDTREPPSEPIRWEVAPDWRLWAWLIAGIGLFAGATSVAGALSTLLAFAGFFALCKALETFVGRYGEGLTEWRQ